MEDRGVSATCILMGRPCSDKNGVFGVWCPPLTIKVGLFLQNQIQHRIAFPTMPRSTPWHLSFPYLCSEHSPPLASPDPPDPIFGISIRF